VCASRPAGSHGMRTAKPSETRALVSPAFAPRSYCPFVADPLMTGSIRFFSWSTLPTTRRARHAKSLALFRSPPIVGSLSLGGKIVGSLSVASEDVCLGRGPRPRYTRLALGRVWGLGFRV